MPRDGPLRVGHAYGRHGGLTARTCASSPTLRAVTSRRMLVLLAPLGTLAAHGLAYWWQGGGDGLHGYLHGRGLPLVAALFVCWVVAAPDARSTALPSVRELVAAQVGVYAGQETLE